MLLVLASIFINEKSSPQIIQRKILGERQNPVEFATIKLQKDSTFLTTAITNELGKFQIHNIPNNNKLSLIKSLIGIQGYLYFFLFKNNTPIDFKTESQSRNLDEVTIVNTKPLFERKIYRLVIVQNSLVALKDDATGIIGQTPLVIRIS